MSLCREAILGDGMGGTAYTLTPSQQDNVILVITRGVHLQDCSRQVACDMLRDSAKAVAAAAEFKFPVGQRAVRGFSVIK